MAYNHSLHDPNVTWEIDEDAKLFRFRALRDLVAGEELFLNYRQRVPATGAR